METNEENQLVRAPLAPGAIIADRYVLVRTIGQGAFGTVFECEDLAVSRFRVAVKIFSSIATGNQSHVQRLARELKVAFSLNHDHVVRFYDSFNWRGMFGYSMEYASKGDLSALVNPSRPVGERSAVEVLLQICSGLEFLHRNGIVHRDLKPSNLLIDAGGVLKISDFGLVGASSQNKNLLTIGCGDVPGRKLTLAGEILGTLDYISPETICGGRADQRADLYALGVVAFELLTGSVPFSNHRTLDLLRSKVEIAAPRLRSLNRSCSKDIEEVVATLLERAPERRFQSAQECREALCQNRGSRNFVSSRTKIAAPSQGTEDAPTGSSPYRPRIFASRLLALFSWTTRSLIRSARWMVLAPLRAFEGGTPLSRSLVLLIMIALVYLLGVNRDSKLVSEGVVAPRGYRYIGPGEALPLRREANSGQEGKW